MIEGLLKKGISQSVSDVDEAKGIVTGYFSSFDVLDSDGDVITKGAYSKTISEWGPTGKGRIKHLEDHNRSRVPAVIKELSEDNFGLRFVSKAGSHSLGQDWYKMCLDGIITEHSVGFKIIKQHKGDRLGEKVNFLTELQLWEGSSMLTWGANEFTPITDVKSQEDFVSLFYKLEKALCSGTYTDETFLEIEKQYKALGQTLGEMSKSGQTTLPGGEADTTKPEERKDEEAAKAAWELVETFKKSVSNGRGE